MPTKEEKDIVTGVDTTGHEWDGVKELNNPLPRWWLYVFYASIIFSIGYMVIYPSVPLGTTYFEGTAEYSDRQAVQDELAAVQESRGGILREIAGTDLAEIRNDADMLQYALAGGEAVFLENCAPCHGSGASGGPGYPNLLDDDWLWGGSLDAIQETIQYGVRWEQNDYSRFSEMPAYGFLGILNRDQIEATAHYVMSLSGLDHDMTLAAAGAEHFDMECVACHEEGGVGNRDLGAPALNDPIWLYGGSRDEIISQITLPRHGVMPAWENRLSAGTIKMLTVYVYELGGGE